MYNYRIYTYLIVLAFLIIIMKSPISAAEFQDRSSLYGIDSISVYLKISDIDSELKKELKENGLDLSLINYFIEHKLQNIGLHTLSDYEEQAYPDKDILSLKLKIIPKELIQKNIYTVDGVKISKSELKNRYLYMVSLELYRSVFLQKKSDTTALAVVWKADSFGYRRAFKIQDDIKGLVDDFIKDFNIVNK